MFKNARLMLTAAACCLATAAGSVHAAVIYVNTGGGVLGDGTSWIRPMLHLADALSVAQAGDEIWVATGVYYPDRSGGNPAGTGLRTASFELKSGVKVFGGFAGTETARTQRNPLSNPTILSGDIGTLGSNADNAYNVVEAIGVNNQTELDGFTIKLGWADAAGFSIDSQGGGVHIAAGAAPTIRNCRFENNLARGGAGIGSFNSSPSIIDCVFVGGNGITRGGGIELTTSTNVLIRGCTFQGNSSAFGGGVYANEGSSGRIEKCSFISNESINGGGTFFAGFSTMTVIDTIYRRNECKQLQFYQTSFNGGAAKNWCTSSVWINCVFNDNHAVGRGGAFFDGGPSGSSGTLINCTIVNNSSRDNGTVFTDANHTTVLRNTIVWNNEDSSPFIGNSQIARTNAPGLASTNGNSSFNPIFADLQGPDGQAGTADDNLTLASSSPLIDMGDNALVPAGVTTDVLGVNRFIDGDAVPGAVVDLGAFEFMPPPPPPCLGDANLDRFIGFPDITAVLQNWGGTGPLGDADFTGSVGFPDITAVLVNWGTDCDIPR